MTGTDVTLPYSLLDVRFTVRCPAGEGQAAVEAICHGFTGAPDDGGQGTAFAIGQTNGAWWVEANGQRTLERGELADALATLEWEIVTAAIGQVPGLFHLHGAALSTPRGDASLLVVGASGVGKTTTTLALVGRGFLPYTDDVILVDPATLAPQSVHRAFHVDASADALAASAGPRRWRIDGMPQGFARPDAWATRALPVKTIVLPSLAPDGPPRARELSTPDGAMALLSFSLTLDAHPRLALSAVARLTGAARCYAVDVAEIALTAELIESLCG